MDVQACVDAARSGGNIAICAVNSTSTLSLVESCFVIASSIAIMITAALAWWQIRHIKLQITTGKDGAIQQITATKDSAVQQIQAARDHGRLAATLNLLTQVQTNERWRANRLRFIKLRDSPTGLKQHVRQDTDDALAIREQLNQYELIALGISSDILDENMYRRFYRGTVIKDWTACFEFIDEERKENRRYWKELEGLVERFKKEG